MRLNVTDALRRHARILVSALQQLALGLPARHRHHAGLAARIDGSRKNGRENRIAIGQGGIERLEYDHPAPFAAHVTIRLCIEAFRPPRRGDHRRGAKPNERHRAQ